MTLVGASQPRFRARCVRMVPDVRFTGPQMDRRPPSLGRIVRTCANPFGVSEAVQIIKRTYPPLLVQGQRCGSCIVRYSEAELMP